MGPGGVALGLRTAKGPALLRLRSRDDRIEATAWGPGSAVALDGVPELCGFGDRPPTDIGPDASVSELHRRSPGLRMCRTNDAMRTLVPAILEQKVTTDEAHRAYSGIVRRHSEAAPGPGRLFLPPDPAVLARLSYFDLHRYGVERRRADIVRSVARLADPIRRLTGDPSTASVLRSLSGVGPWTTSLVMQSAFGDADAALVGDYHMPNIVGWYFDRSERATDERMLALLEPFKGQRARVQRLIVGSGIRPPSRGIKKARRNIASI
jgi:3-methyladenine DNA glycosylase/8-oxoguanine DNA glycosylase